MYCFDNQRIYKQTVRIECKSKVNISPFIAAMETRVLEPETKAKTNDIKIIILYFYCLIELNFITSCGPGHG